MHPANRRTPVRASLSPALVPRRGGPALKPARTRCSRLPLALLAALLASAVSGFEIRNGTVAGGGAIVAADEFLLISTLGEPAMGTVSKGEFRLTSGFPATLSDDGGALPIDGPIFSDGFESLGSD